MTSPNINPEGWAIITGVMVSVLTATWLSIKWLFAPRMKEAITETIKESVGPQISKIPELTDAVNRLTGALENQSQDTDRLNTTIENLDKKIENVGKQMGDLAQRTANLEGQMPMLAKTAEQSAKIVESAALAAQAAGEAAGEAAATVLRLVQLTKKPRTRKK